MGMKNHLITMAEQGTSHITIEGGDDKYAIIVTAINTLNGVMVPYQIIYTENIIRCLP